MGRNGIVYTPKKTKEAENLIAEKAVQHMHGKPPFEGPVKLYLEFIYEIPKSWSKKKRAEAIEGKYKISRPDMDNCEKTVMDALNGIVFVDDAQVASKETVKIYGDQSHVIIKVTPL